MQIVIIEDQPIIANSIRSEFKAILDDNTEIIVLGSIDEVVNFNFEHASHIVSDLYLGTSIHETIQQLYKIRLVNSNTSISVFTQSTDIPNIESFLCLIQAQHLFDKRFCSTIAETVLFGQPQCFSANKIELAKALSFINISGNSQSILEDLARHESVKSIAMDSCKSKSAISQAVKRIENQIGSKRHYLRMFFKQV